MPIATASPESISNIRLNKTEARPGETLVVTADISSPSGINWVNLILYPPSGGSKGFTTYFNLISGTEQNGTWSMSFTIPQTAENGIWGLVVGMQTKENLVKTTFGPSINITGSTTLETKIVKISLSKLKSRPGESLIVTADITSPSGINWVNLILYPPSGGSKGFTTYFNLVSGSEQNGTWSMSFPMSPTAESGTWGLVVGMQTKENLVKTSYGPSFTVSTEAEDLAAKAAADKAAADAKARQEAEARTAATALIPPGNVSCSLNSGGVNFGVSISFTSGNFVIGNLTYDWDYSLLITGRDPTLVSSYSPRQYFKSTSANALTISYEDLLSLASNNPNATVLVFASPKNVLGDGSAKNTSGKGCFVELKSVLNNKLESEKVVAAELKAKQEAEIKAIADKAVAELKAKQEAELKAAAELKAIQDAEMKAAAELKAKQEATVKAAAKKTTITCVKGKLTKKITAVKPLCPAGYKKK